MLKPSKFMPLYIAAIVGSLALSAASCSAEEPKKEEPAAAAPASSAPAAAPAAGGDAAAPAVVAVTGKPPLDVAKDHAWGTMKSPFADAKPETVEEGKKLYFSYSCNGCHGGGGGGGMCPPLTNDTWVYGAADDTLFRLISHGSQELQKTYSVKRKGQESVVGPMPPFGTLVKSDEEVWKIIAFIRSLYHGNKKLW